ncbi:hypothetical protein GCM10023213_18860 [Prosthecobacter algae]|uniref:Plasmid stabilization system protein ParE n=1 Tax=Prosthecobacter algae TaxID=1144682 RepID=A0ABP9P1Z1_9BACT
MSWKLHLAPDAVRCIEDQMRWYEEDEQRGGSDLADRWLGKLETALSKLNQHPERHGFAPENGRWQPHLELRQMRFVPWKSKPGWRLLYVLDEGRQHLTLLQVRHERRPWLVD